MPLKDGSFLISERDTRKIVRVDNGSTSSIRTIDEADPAGEGGLLGLAITENEKTVFAYYTAANDNRIVSMSWASELGAPKVILRGIPKAFIHNGGRGDRPDAICTSAPAKVAMKGCARQGLTRRKILRLRLDGRPAPGTLRQ